MKGFGCLGPPTLETQRSVCRFMCWSWRISDPKDFRPPSPPQNSSIPAPGRVQPLLLCNTRRRNPQGSASRESLDPEVMRAVALENCMQLTWSGPLSNIPLKDASLCLCNYYYRFCSVRVPKQGSHPLPKRKQGDVEMSLQKNH